jgi:hypothetical protein
LARGSLTWEDFELEASLGSVRSPCFKEKTNKQKDQTQWLRSVILAAWEVEIGREFKINLGKKKFVRPHLYQ